METNEKISILLSAIVAITLFIIGSIEYPKYFPNVDPGLIAGNYNFYQEVNVIDDQRNDLFYGCISVGSKCDLLQKVNPKYMYYSDSGKVTISSGQDDTCQPDHSLIILDADNIWCMDSSLTRFPFYIDYPINDPSSDITVNSAIVEIKGIRYGMVLHNVDNNDLLNEVK